MKRYPLWLAMSLMLLVTLWGCGGAQNQNPTAQFNVQPAAAVAGTAVTLDAAASKDPDGKINKYEWTLADGTKLSGAKVNHTFAAAGSFEVTLTVTDDKNATATAKQTVQVAAAPVVDNTPDDSNTSNNGGDNAAGGDDAATVLAHHIEMSKGTTIRIAAGSEPRYLTPNGTEGTWESQISGLIFDGLVEPTDRFETIPAMAHSWEWDPENLTYTLHLREGIKFHDFAEAGETLDCGDVMFSFKAWIHPDYPGVRFSNYENIVGAQAYREGTSTEWPIPGLTCVDDLTFKVQLDSVQRTFLPYAVSAVGIMPQHVYEPYFEEHGYDQLKGVDTGLGKTIGSGPYQLAEWSASQFVKLERFDDYWRGAWGRGIEVEDQVAFPGIDEVYWVVMPDTDQQYAALLAGEIDVLDTRSNVDQYFQLKDNPNFATFVYSQLTYDYWHWNLRNELFQDVNVRKAMCSALDRQQMVDNVLRGLGELTNGPSHPLRWDWDDSLNEIHPGYDPEEAVRLMEEAGWTIEKNDDGSIKKDAVWTKTKEDGTVLRMEFEIAHNTPNQRRQDFAVIMQQQLSKAGFRGTVKGMETNAFYNDYLQGSNAFQTAIAGWRMGTDPDGTSLWHTDSLDPNGFNWHAYSNPEVDRLLEEGLQLAEIDEARPLYQQINRMLVETMGYCWLAFPSATFAAKPGLMGTGQWSPLSPYSHLTEWYWEGKGVPVTVME